MKRTLARWLHNLSVRLGGPSAYHDGIPAAAELDDMASTLDELAIPRDFPCPDGSRWPLTTAQRLTHYHLPDRQPRRLETSVMAPDPRRSR